MRRSRRRGLSLLEVILAIAILGGALATIGQLIRVGARNAAEARDLTMAQLYAESEMNGIAAGWYPMDEVSDEKQSWAIGKLTFVKEAELCSTP